MAALLSAHNFATLAGLSDIKASEVLNAALSGNSWRNTELQVHSQEGRGRGGKVLMVNPDSLPDGLRRDYYLQKAKEDGQDMQGLTGERLEVALYRYGLIAEASRLPKRTRARREAVLAVLGRVYAHPIKTQQLSESMLYDWLRRYEANGMQGLAPKLRADKGRTRNKLSRPFDVVAQHLEPEIADQVIESIRQAIASYWASGVPGWRQVLEYAEMRLKALCEEQGFCLVTWPDSPVKAMSSPFLNRRTVEAYREYQIVHTCDADAKRFFDIFLPRIGRHREGLQPLDLVIGDVHPIDIMLRREDGSEVYPRAIAWHDVATGRAFFTLILLAKGEGVKQVHVAQSFASMCSAWGFPSCLYLDNGSEYNWAEMLRGFIELATISKLDIRFLNDLPPEQRYIVRSRPYNAPAKAIEGLFSVLEQSYLRQIEGWTAGDRTNKKTHNIGQAPKHFSGGWDDFHNAIEVALDRYHKRPQDTFGQRSPNEVLQGFIDSGWAKTTVSEEALLFAFSIEDTRKADRGRIQYNNQHYYHDAILPFTGKTLKVRIPRHDPSLLFVFAPDGRLLCAAPPEQKYGYLDGEGAVEQARRAGVMRRYVASLRNYSSRLDLVDVMDQWNRTQPDVPTIPSKAQVTLTDDVQQMLAAAQAAEENTLDHAIQARKDQQQTPQLSQWSNPDEDDRYLKAVGFSD